MGHWLPFIDASPGGKSSFPGDKDTFHDDKGPLPGDNRQFPGDKVMNPESAQDVSMGPAKCTPSLDSEMLQSWVVLESTDHERYAYIMVYWWIHVCSRLSCEHSDAYLLCSDVCSEVCTETLRLWFSFRFL